MVFASSLCPWRKTMFSSDTWISFAFSIVKNIQPHVAKADARVVTLVSDLPRPPPPQSFWLVAWCFAWHWIHLPHTSAAGRPSSPSPCLLLLLVPPSWSAPAAFPSPASPSPASPWRRTERKTKKERKKGRNVNREKGKKERREQQGGKEWERKQRKGERE